MDYTTIRSILTNEKYKGDAIINKTYIDNCINKKIKTNNGERTKYYVENNHPAIIDSSIYDKVQEAIMKAVIEMSKQNNKLLNTLKSHIQTALKREIAENNILDIEFRIAEIDTEFKKMISQVSEDNADNFDEEYLSKLMEEKQKLTKQLENIQKSSIKQKDEEIRFEQIYTILDGMQNHSIKYDDNLIRQILECVVVESKDKIKIVFKGGEKL